MPDAIVDTEFPRTVRVIEHQVVAMSDGCQLSVRMWLPEDAHDSPVPAIVEHLPYRKRDGTIVRDSLTHPWFAGHGYACLRIDMRGNGESEGLMDDEYTEQEWRDACDVIAWACQQDWCTGTVGMMGISWGGFNALQVAALRPPGLKAIITLCSTVDRFADDIHYKGGCLLGENAGWAANMLSYSSRPPDPELLGDRWRELWLDRLENMPFLAKPWLTHQHRSAYWQHGSVCDDYPSIEAAVLSIGGWHDGYRNTISHLVSNLSAPVKGIVGPWIHKYPHYAGPAPTIGFLQEALRWWDHWLKGEDTHVDKDPDYRVWLMDSIAPQRWFDHRPGRWIAETDWPSANVASIEYVLGPLDGLQCDHELPVAVSSPCHCGSATGEYFPFTYGPELPDDQRVDDELSVCFDGNAVPDTIDIVGAPVVQLACHSDQALAQLAIRLCDLRPDGSSALISHGMFNLTHWQGSEAPERLQVGATFPVTVTLDQIAYRLPAGHRLRLAVSTQYWPFIWPSPIVSTVTIESGSLQLPTRHTASVDRNREEHSEYRFPPAHSAPPWKHRNHRPSSSTRTTETEPDGTVLSIVHNDFGEDEDLDHGLIAGSRTTEHWRIHPNDPLTARSDFHWEQTMSRGEWSVQTQASLTLTCDVNDFIVTGSLVAHEGDTVVFEREYAERIPRQFV